MSTSTSKDTFRKVNLITIVLLFVLILAGGVVRSSGSGMGCPDWPKCFGGYIPPIDASQLPKDYKQQYVNGRVVKNKEVAKSFDFFGYTGLAQRIRSDKSILIPEDFNVAKAWTEYINRLIGAISGFAMLFTLVFSFSYIKENAFITVLSLLNLLFVALEAWLGSIVVSTNLFPWLVTAHMLIALAILAVAISTYYLAKVYGKKRIELNPIVYLVTLLVIIISIVQIIFGTEVREKIDEVANHLQGGYRSDWIAGAGEIFFQHRNMAILILIGNVALYALIRRSFGRHSIQQQLMSFTFLMIMLQIVTGIILEYGSLPPYMQTVHILFASLIFSAQFYLLLNLHRPVTLHGGYR
jgi:cytochrome c oxidase assembly protein subunit 15